MDLTLIFKFLPLIIQAINAGKQISDAVSSGGSVRTILEQQGPEVIKLVKAAGAQLFPKLSSDDQAEAGATRFDLESVKKIQAQLVKLGATLDVDGYYGKMTKAAVTAFQEKNSLDVDGWAGPLTQAALDKATA